MKASEILKKRLEINSSWYGCDTYKIVDFDVVGDGIRLYYDSYYNSESHIYRADFNFIDASKLFAGGEAVTVMLGEVTTTTTYKLID